MKNNIKKNLKTLERILFNFKSENIECKHPEHAEIECESYERGFNNAVKLIKQNLDKLSVDVCQHESDGNVYTSNPPQYKCKKCGEFYR